MRRFATGLLTSIFLVGTLAAAAGAWPGSDRSHRHPLEGAWKLIGTLAENEDVVEPPPPGFEEYKVVADGCFIWTAIQDGHVTGTAGGMARMGQATYMERVDFASEQRLAWIVGRRHTFRWKIEGGRWYHTGDLVGDDGKRARVAEVWERVR